MRCLGCECRIEEKSISVFWLNNEEEMEIGMT